MSYELSKEEENKDSWKNLRNFKILFFALGDLCLKGIKSDYSRAGDAEFIENFERLVINSAKQTHVQILPTWAHLPC